MSTSILTYSSSLIIMNYIEKILATIGLGGNNDSNVPLVSSSSSKVEKKDNSSNKDAVIDVNTTTNNSVSTTKLTPIDKEKDINKILDKSALLSIGSWSDDQTKYRNQSNGHIINIFSDEFKRGMLKRIKQRSYEIGKTSITMFEMVNLIMPEIEHYIGKHNNPVKTYEWRQYISSSTMATTTASSSNGNDISSMIESKKLIESNNIKLIFGDVVKMKTTSSSSSTIPIWLVSCEIDPLFLNYQRGIQICLDNPISEWITMSPILITNQQQQQQHQQQQQQSNNKSYYQNHYINTKISTQPISNEYFINNPTTPTIPMSTINDLSSSLSSNHKRNIVSDPLSSQKKDGSMMVINETTEIDHKQQQQKINNNNNNNNIVNQKLTKFVTVTPHPYEIYANLDYSDYRIKRNSLWAIYIAGSSYEHIDSELIVSTINDYCFMKYCLESIIIIETLRDSMIPKKLQKQLAQMYLHIDVIADNITCFKIVKSLRDEIFKYIKMNIMSTDLKAFTMVVKKFDEKPWDFISQQQQQSNDDNNSNAMTHYTFNINVRIRYRLFPESHNIGQELPVEKVSSSSYQFNNNNNKQQSSSSLNFNINSSNYAMTNK